MIIFNKQFIKEFFKRNKKLLIIAITIVFISFIGGIIYRYMAVPNHSELTNALITKGHVNPDPFFPIFSHNIISSILMLIGGFVISIPSLIMSVMNGLMMGSIVGVDPTFGLIGLIPHGIFELLADVFSLTGAFIITKFEINIIKAIISNELSIKDVISSSKDIYKELILIFVIIVILLIIGGIFETKIDCLIANAFFHI
ncbi:MAG: stage II sporulation protein M [archaeon]|nr:stage II sporulation protein M [archaeon]